MVRNIARPHPSPPQGRGSSRTKGARGPQGLRKAPERDGRPDRLAVRPEGRQNRGAEKGAAGPPRGRRPLLRRAAASGGCAQRHCGATVRSVSGEENGLRPRPTQGSLRSACPRRRHFVRSRCDTYNSRPRPQRDGSGPAPRASAFQPTAPHKAAVLPMPTD